MTETGDEARIVKDLSIPLYQAKGWMKFLAVMLILGGVLTVLTIWGILVAWLPIWAGVVLYQAAGALEEVQLGSGRREALERALGKLKTYFMISGILVLIWVIVSVLGLLLGIGMMAGMGGMGGPGMMGGGY